MPFTIFGLLWKARIVALSKLAQLLAKIIITCTLPEKCSVSTSKASFDCMLILNINRLKLDFYEYNT